MIRKHPIGTLSFLAVLLAPLTACYVEPIHEVDGSISSEEIYVSEPAPALRTEVVVGVAPTPNHVWVGGYWARHRDGWYWVSGRWAARPRHDAVWVDGHWDHQPRGYVWVGGRWR